MRTARRSLSGLVLAGGMVALLAAPAAAHVTANPNTFEAGGYARTAFRVPHGCDGSPTTAIEVQIPSGVVGVKAEQVPGWEVETVVGELDEPYESHGETITEGVLEVSWTAAAGSELPDDQFREFGLSVRLPDAAGETLWFPTIQTCEEGEIGWIQIPGDGESWGELEAPAPYVELTEGGGHGHGDDDATGDEEAEDADQDAAEDEDAAAADDTATEQDDDELDVDLAATPDGGTDTLTWVALLVGLLGAALGTAGLLAARKRG
jgi:uncharacterized protein YcnI